MISLASNKSAATLPQHISEKGDSNLEQALYGLDTIFICKK
jgi:hypothetical protein